MVLAATTTDLLSAVRLRAQLPTADGRISTAEILDLATDVMRTTIADLLISTRSQRWTSSAADVSITSGTYLYAVPERALAQGVTDILIVDGTSVTSAVEIPQQDAYIYQVTRGVWEAPYAYCWRDDFIELLPHPTATSGSLRILYPRTPGKLVETSACAVVSSLGATTITTVATVPSTFASSDTLDVVSARNGAPRGIDQACTSVGGTSITIGAGVPSGTLAGDYVCEVGETPVPNLPASLYPALVNGTVLRVVAALGDTDHAQLAAGVAEITEKAGKRVLEPRNRGQAQRVTARHTPLRIMRGFR